METTMTTGGWIFMISSWSLIIILNIFCLKNLFKEKQDKIVGPLEIEGMLDKQDTIDNPTDDK